MKFHFRSHDHHHGGGGVAAPCSPTVAAMATDHPSALIVIDPHGRETLACSHGGEGGADADRGLGCECARPPLSPPAGQSFSVADTARPYQPGAEPDSYEDEMDRCPQNRASADRATLRNASGGGEDAAAKGDVDHDGNEGNTSPASPSKRALHLEQDGSSAEDSCPHSRPRSRQFFRLGRLRGGSHAAAAADKHHATPVPTTARDPFRDGLTSDGSEEDLTAQLRLEGGRHRRASLMTDDGRSRHPKLKPKKTRRHFGMRPMLRRAQSLPVAPASALHSDSEEATAASPQTESELESEAGRPARYGVDFGGFFVPIVGGSGGGLPAVEATSLAEDAVPARSDANGVASDVAAEREPSPEDCKPTRHRRHVTFTSVSIREYSTILGDHPCCDFGPPLSLGWNLEREDSMEFELYERERGPVRRGRGRDDMRLGGDVRREILRGLVVGGEGGMKGSGGDVDNNDGRNPTDDSNNARGCAVYTARDLDRAERRLSRERRGNSRAQQRMNKHFFRSLTPDEEGGGGEVIVARTMNHGDVDQEDPGKTKRALEPVVVTSPASLAEDNTTMDVSPAGPR